MNQTDVDAGASEGQLEMQQRVVYAPDYRIEVPSAFFVSTLNHPDRSDKLWVIQFGHDGPRHHGNGRQGAERLLRSEDVRYITSEMRLSQVTAVDCLSLALKVIRRSAPSVYDEIIARVDASDDATGQ